MGEKRTILDATYTVCEFLELEPVSVDSNDTLDSLTSKIETRSSPFASKIKNLSLDYSPLKINNMLSAVMIKYGCELMQEKIVDDNVLRSLYHISVKKLDTILISLSRDYCANNCHSEQEFHCCSKNAHSMEFTDEYILKLQEKESILSVEKHDTLHNGCQFLNKDGCTLTISKPPACIGFLCGPLRAYVRSLAPTNYVDFIFALNKVIDPTFTILTQEKIIGFDHAIHYGKLVLEEKKSPNIYK